MRKKNPILFLLLLILLQINCSKSSNQPSQPPAPTPQMAELISTIANSITTNSAICGATITLAGSSPVTSRGICYSTSGIPTILNTKVDAGSGTGAFTVTLTGLTHNTVYYFRPYATNSSGTAYGNLGTFTTLRIFSIGENYDGGKIFYIDPSGQHGLIAGPNLGGAPFGCSGYSINGAYGTAVGTGLANTIAINPCTPPTAANYCYDLNVNGFSDWYLPSKDELNLLYQQKSIIGGFGNLEYWSSSQSDLYFSWSQNFTDGSQQLRTKSIFCEVRAIRSY